MQKKPRAIIIEYPEYKTKTFYFNVTQLKMRMSNECLTQKQLIKFKKQFFVIHDVDDKFYIYINNDNQLKEVLEFFKDEELIYKYRIINIDSCSEYNNTIELL